MHAAHLQAEAPKIKYIEASKFELIEEEGHEGKEANSASSVCHIVPTSNMTFYAEFNTTSRLWFLSRGIFWFRDEKELRRNSSSHPFADDRFCKGYATEKARN